ncbi:hypothetical protein FGO68_gene7318 [Halteria grandinella]|uniref:Uncharacterized protein n=1 Tax=Halteria grandinella TaxID=5974 RepID=A0A8J8NX94_HALGN|nr:hypothetical protein FGO68_gene7318 [Halteria grandinella]
MCVSKKSQETTLPEYINLLKSEVLKDFAKSRDFQQTAKLNEVASKLRGEKVAVRRFIDESTQLVAEKIRVTLIKTYRQSQQSKDSQKISERINRVKHLSLQIGINLESSIFDEDAEIRRGKLNNEMERALVDLDLILSKQTDILNSFEKEAKKLFQQWLSKLEEILRETILFKDQEEEKVPVPQIEQHPREASIEDEIMHETPEGPLHSNPFAPPQTDGSKQLFQTTQQRSGTTKTSNNLFVQTKLEFPKSPPLSEFKNDFFKDQLRTKPNAKSKRLPPLPKPKKRPQSVRDPQNESIGPSKNKRTNKAKDKRLKSIEKLSQKTDTQSSDIDTNQGHKNDYLMFQDESDESLVKVVKAEYPPIQEEIKPLTVPEVEEALYFMPRDNEMHMVHIDSSRVPGSKFFINRTRGKNGLEEIHVDEEFKPRFLFAQIHLIIEGKFRALLIGMRKRYLQHLFEYRIEDEDIATIFDQEEDTPLNFQTKINDCSFAVWNGQTLLKTGGSERLPHNDMIEFQENLFLSKEDIEIALNEEEKVIDLIDSKSVMSRASRGQELERSGLEAILRNIPKLKQDRQSHCSFVHKDWLFVSFGKRDITIYADNIECLNLANIEQGFIEIPLEGEEKNLLHPMIFEHLEQIFVFGGKPELSRRAQTNAAPLISSLKELVIEWSEETGCPTSARLLITANPNNQPVIFQGQPIFSGKVPNKRHLPEHNSWLFVDDGGNYYIYNTKEKSTMHKCLLDSIKSGK